MGLVASISRVFPRRSGTPAISLRFHLASLCLLALIPVNVSAQSVSGPYLATPQRPTFTSDTSTTAPGTIELQTGGTFSDGLFTLPTTLKFTPGVASGFFRSGEFSASFDAVTVLSANGRSHTRFGDRIDLAWRRPVYSRGRVSAAAVPLFTVFTRDASGVRLGAAGILAYAAGRSAAVLNASLTGATSASPSNPSKAGTIAADFLHTLSGSGPWSTVTVFAGLQSEHAARHPNVFSLGQGILWRVRPNLVLDAALRETRLNLHQKDLQLLLGLTLNFGRLQR